MTTPAYVSESQVRKFILDRSDWIISKLEKQEGLPIPAAGNRKDYLKYRSEALVLAQVRLVRFNKFYKLVYNKVTIKNHKTLWGSCSRRGNLNFNYRIALIPEEQSDYVIVHELCHLAEFNHSSRFWDLVARTIPEHKRIRREIKQRGLSFS